MTAAMAVPSELWQSAPRSHVEPTPLAPDIATVLAVIRRRPKAGCARERQLSWCPDLSETDLRGANFREADLHGVDFHLAHLERADFHRAHLELARFDEAHLESANLNLAYLQHAFLNGAHLERAVNLREAIGLDKAFGSSKTRLRDDIARPPRWPAYDPDLG
jgi:hypothetical protein